MEHFTGRPAQIPGWCRSRWAGLALVGFVFAIVATLSWRRWPDSLVDFGMQLYLPWRISEGDVLYRDVMYLAGGPLSQYFNALLFKIFGVSFQTLILANLAITAGMLILIYRRFLAVSDPLTATMIGLGIVLVFAFQHLELVGNCNYVTPYCHEVFHGLVLSIVVVTWLSDWVEKKQIRFAVAAGLGSGLVFLTKPDVFLALSVCAAAAIVVVWISPRQAGFAANSLAAFLVAGLIPPLAFFIFFLRTVNWQASARAVGSAWSPLWHTSVVGDLYYRWCLGLDTPLLHLGKMTGYFIFVVLLTAIYARLSRGDVASRFKRMKSLWIVWWLLVSPLLILGMVLSWVDCGRVLPLLVLSACVLLVVNYRKTALAPGAVFPLLWNVLGLVLLAKLGFFTRIWHYGFALAMPAFAGAVYLFVWLLPRLLEQRYQVRFHFFRLAACAVLLTGFVHLFLRSESYYLLKNTPVGVGGDRVMTYGPAVSPFHDNVQLALSWIQTNVPPGAPLAVLPEGAMINYLGRHVNPTSYPVWLPPEMEVFGQTNMIAAFQKSSPDYVVILERSTAEYGMGYFGFFPGYGTDLMEWIDEHYDRVYPAPGSTGKSAPVNHSFFQLQILKKRLPS